MSILSLSVLESDNAVTMDKGGIGEETFARFIEYLDAKPRTIESYMKNLRAFVRWMQDNGITQPGRADIIAYRDWLLTTHKAATVQAYIFTVRRFFDWASEEGLYENIASHVKGAKVGNLPKKDYLTSTQTRDVLKGVDSKRDKAIIALMVSCALRCIEVVRANVEDLRTVGNATVLYVQGKGRDEKAEFVTVPAHTEKVVREYLKTRGTVSAGDPLFVSESKRNKGERMTTRSISGIVKGAMVEAGFNSDRLTAHSLRHTGITIALLNNASLQAAQQYARHASINMTLRYAHNLERVNNKCSALVADSIFDEEE